MTTRLLTSLLRRRFYLFVLLIFIAVLIYGFIYTYYRYTSFYDINFWQNAVSNFISTFLGLFFGIPIALWINEIQQKSINQVESEKLQDEALQRKKKILDSLRVELNSALELFISYPGYPRLTEDTFENIYFTSNAPSLEVWKSFSDGGELQWIKDSNLLMTLAWTYYSIQQVKDSGQLLVECAFIHPPRSGKVITEYIHKQFETNVSDATKIIEDALNKINAQN